MDHVFVLTRTLETEKFQEDRLEKFFKKINSFQNYLIKYTLSNYKKMIASEEWEKCIETESAEKKAYKSWLERKTAAQEDGKKFTEKKPVAAFAKTKSSIRKKYCLDTYSLFHFISEKSIKSKSDDTMISLSKRYGLPATVSRGVALRVIAAWDKIIEGNGKYIRTKKEDETNTIPCVSNDSGLYFKDEVLNVHIGNKKNYMVIPVKESAKDWYYYDAIKNEVVTCAIKREWKDGKRLYSVVLTLKGTEPELRVGDRPFVAGNMELGIDLGVSKVAVADKDGDFTKIIPFKKIPRITEEEKIIQIRMDEIKRQLNPDNYDENGVAIKGHKKWKYNDEYYRLRRLKASYDNLRAKQRKIEINKAAKTVAEISINAKIETNKVCEWQQNDKGETVINEKTGRPKSKKGMGKHIADYAPSSFVERYDQLCTRFGGKLTKIDEKYKATQICSCCGYVEESVIDLSIRKWDCPNCMAEHDRDINAAINIARQDAA